MVRTRGVDKSKRHKIKPSSPPHLAIQSGPGQSSSVPTTPHPLSQFSSGEQRERYQLLSTLPIHPNYAFNLEELNKVGLGDSVMQILRTSKWDLFVQINEAPYKELLLEFLATFSFEKCSITFDLPNTVQFRLGDNRFQLSLTEFSVHYGFYTPEFTGSPEYQQCLTDLGNAIPAVVWSDFCTPDAPVYDPRMTKGFAIRDPAL